MQRGEHLGGLAARLLLLCAAGWQATAQSGWPLSSPSPIQQQTAEAVVRDLGLDSASGVVAQKLQVLAPFASLPAGATIHVVSARRGFTPGTWLLRLDCASRRDCLPFHAMLRERDFQSQFPPSGGPVTPKLPVPHGGRLLTSAALARRGDQVELVEKLPGVRLRARAVCLESGALGDRIRVENRATHRVLLATVAGQGWVRVER